MSSDVTSAATSDAAEEDSDCRCGNCNWQGRESAIKVPFFRINRMEARVEPNELVPAGECPDCGCLAHRVMSQADRARLLVALKGSGVTWAEIAESVGVGRAASAAATRAMQLHATDEIEFDERVFLSEAEGGTWVSCWAWVDTPEAESESDSQRRYRVSLKELPGEKFTMIFDCSAEDADHAAEQALNAYPGCEILSTVPMENVE